MSVLCVAGCILLMHTVTMDNLRHFTVLCRAPVDTYGRAVSLTHFHTEAVLSLENRSAELAAH